MNLNLDIPLFKNKCRIYEIIFSKRIKFLSFAGRGGSSVDSRTLARDLEVGYVYYFWLNKKFGKKIFLIANIERVSVLSFSAFILNYTSGSFQQSKGKSFTLAAGFLAESIYTYK